MLTVTWYRRGIKPIIVVGAGISIDILGFLSKERPWSQTRHFCGKFCRRHVGSHIIECLVFGTIFKFKFSEGDVV